MLSFALVLALLFLTACGKKSVQVRTPRPAPVPAAKPETAKRPPETRPRETPPATPPAAPEAAAPPAAAAAPSPSELPYGPPIRIGLTTAAKEIRIAAAGDYTVTQKVAEAAGQLVRGEIRIRVEQPGDAVPAVTRIQVASFANAAAAEGLRAKLAAAFAHPVVVRENAETGTNQVRIGEFASKEAAQPLVAELAASGYPDAFPVVDSAAAAGRAAAGAGRATLALRGANGLFLLSPSGFLVQPVSAASVLSLDGKPYRGILDVVPNGSGTMTVVNQLGMEEYLQGVIPAEMHPSRYPEFAGLAALTIAARTYALKNMGRFRADGFDLTADTRTQVYGGIEVEQDATTEAVRRTSGMAVYYRDKLIDALYMSTCGGRTEDFALVYDAPDVPYLKSVFCAVESGPEKGATVLEGKHELAQPVFADDGSVANRNIELSRVLGILGGEALSAEYLAAGASRDEVVEWVRKARALAVRNPGREPTAGSDIGTRSGFFVYAAEALFGSAEIRRTVSTRDAAYSMDNLRDGGALPEAARYALAYVSRKGLWRPGPDNAVRPDEPIRRGDALFLLVRWAEALRPDLLGRGTFVTAGSGDSGGDADPVLRVQRGKQTRDVRLSAAPRLFRVDSGGAIPVGSAKIIGNEKIAFCAGPSGTVDFLEIELNPGGASSDRYSPVAEWDATFTRAAMAEKLRGLAGNIGQFQDMEPSAIGNSGRAVQVLIRGTRGSVKVNGYKVRNALGLRDTLYTIHREYNADGSVAGFTFHGRGWGHGVGLCQVGAFGMARSGHTYEEILKTYYQGVEIKKAY